MLSKHGWVGMLVYIAHASAVKNCSIIGPAGSFIHSNGYQLIDRSSFPYVYT